MTPGVSVSGSGSIVGGGTIGPSGLPGGVGGVGGVGGGVEPEL
jgi:hypothetical protein